MKKNKGRYELKLRTTAQGYNSARSSKPNTAKKGDKLTNRSIICAAILIAVMIIKLSNFTFTDKALEKLKYLISEQTDFTESAEEVAQSVSDMLGEWRDGDIPASAEAPQDFVAPLKSGTVSYGFGQTVHPVFNTAVEPTGIGITSEPQAFVYAGLDASVSSVSINGDGSIRVVLDAGNGLSIAYDNLSMTYFSKGDMVAAKQIIGMLADSRDATLIFEVWQNGEAQDPLLYLGDIY